MRPKCEPQGCGKVFEMEETACTIAPKKTESSFWQPEDCGWRRSIRKREG